MLLLEKIELVFNKTDVQELDADISDLGDELEYCELSADEVRKVVNCLLNHIKNYKEATIVENILNSCLRIMNSHGIFSGFDLDCVSPCIGSLNNECLSYMLTFWGFSGEEKYRTLIESFLTRDGLEEDARESLLELDYGTNN